ncbi:MAG: tRNA epoxyqueuosine(34) reductase QueG [Owenweeksia sp.]
MDKPSKYSQLIKKEAERLGFMACGVSRADFLEKEAPKLEEWLKRDYHGQMQWMENHFDKRLDPRKLVDGAKSVVSVILNYYPEKTQPDPDAPKIAKYAYGEDYHFVIKRRLKSLMEFIQSEIGEVHGRAFVDSAPVMDRAWAEKSGLGWIGKHTLLLTKGAGSFYFIGELILDIELTPDAPVADHCGECTRCIDACPTDAIIGPQLLDSSKCISYLTIELKDEIPQAFSGKMENWAFGCDICQDVCPWNRFSKPHSTPEFDAPEKMLKMDRAEWTEITEEVFKEIFKRSAVKRTKYAGLKRNIQFLKHAGD